MRALVIYCHPNPESLIAAARDRAVAGLSLAGHEIRVTDLYADGFDPVLSSSERLTHKTPGVGADLQRHADDLAWAEALVLIYPTWWSGLPAMLKGWVDRAWVAGVAWKMDEGASQPTPLLRNVRRIVVVTSHGSSKLVNALQGESGKRTAFRSIRLMCARRTRTTWSACCTASTGATTPRGVEFLDRVERTLARLS